MESAVATKTRRGGDKRSRLTISRHLKLVEDRLTSGHPRYSVIRELGGKGVARSTVDRYIETVQQRWHEEAELAAPHVREQCLARLTSLSMKAEKEGRYASVARFEEMRCKLLGVYAPVQHEVRGAIAVAQVSAPGVDLSKASDALLDELERIADGAIGAPAGLIGDTTVVSP